MCSWRPATTKAYNTYIKKWQEYVKTHEVTSQTYVDVSNFLAELYNSGASHNTINLARSAVSAYLNSSGSTPLGSHPVVCRLMKGVFENRPSLPKYNETWDVDTVVECLAGWPDTGELTLKQLTLRTVMLLALLSGQRGQSIHSLKVEDIKLYADKCVIVYSSLLKQTKPGVHVKPLELSAFDNKRLCIVTHLREYLHRTKSLRAGDKLLVSFVKPYHHISRDTLSRWLKTVLDLAGIDLNRFSAHSTRTASTSAAFSRDVPLDTILTTAGWSRQKTFSKFYCKPVVSQKSLAQSVLDKFVNKNL